MLKPRKRSITTTPCLRELEWSQGKARLAATLWCRSGRGQLPGGGDDLSLRWGHWLNWQLGYLHTNTHTHTPPPQIMCRPCDPKTIPSPGEVMLFGKKKHTLPLFSVLFPLKGGKLYLIADLSGDTVGDTGHSRSPSLCYLFKWIGVPSGDYSGRMGRPRESGPHSESINIRGTG